MTAGRQQPVPNTGADRPSPAVALGSVATRNGISSAELGKHRDPGRAMSEMWRKFGRCMNCNHEVAPLSHMTENIRTKLQKVDWRLGRALALVAIGAAMHLPRPGQAVAPVPETAPLNILDLTTRPFAPRLNLERTTIFAPVTPELEKRTPPPRKDIPATLLGAGRSRSASLTIDERPEELRGAVPTTGIGGTAEFENASDSVRTPPQATAEAAPTSNDRVDVDLPRAGPLSTTSMVRAAHASADGERPDLPVAASSGTPPPSEEDRVRRLLAEYAGAYERLDVGAAQAVYPSVDAKGLKRAFAQLESQRVTLQSCGITISGSTANAICRGNLTYQPRIGTRPVQIASREWMFDLSKKDTAWKIVNTFVR